MADHTETTMRVVRGGIDDFTEALSWALNVKDTQFASATMVRFELEQSLHWLDTETDATYQWTAMVSGLMEET